MLVGLQKTIVDLDTRANRWSHGGPAPTENYAATELTQVIKSQFTEENYMKFVDDVKVSFLSEFSRIPLFFRLLARELALNAMNMSIT